MKKIISMSITALLMGVPGSLYAQTAVCQFISGGYQMGPDVFFGPTTCSAGDLGELSVNGPLTLQGTKIKTLTVNGPLTMNGASVQRLTINGLVKATESHIDTLTINGKAYLLNSQVNSIMVPTSPQVGEYEIYLEGSTLVKSNIIFQKDKGIVYKSKDATIKGSVKGAVVRSFQDK